MRVLISIIVPVYNVKKYLCKCVDSLLAQTICDIEIILVDDGSTDGSGLICDSYIKKDHRIRVIHKTNGGLSSARNAGLDVARGDFLGFVDSDDWVEPDTYQAMLSACLNNKAQIAVCGRINEYSSRSEGYFLLPFCEYMKPKQALRRILLYDGMDSSVCDKLFSRNTIGNLRFPDGAICEDIAIIYKVISKASGVVHIGEAKYHYLQRDDSISKVQFSLPRMGYYYHAKEFKEFIVSEFPGLSIEADSFFFRAIIYLLKSIEVDSTKDFYRAEYMMLYSELSSRMLIMLFNRYVDIRLKIDSFFLLIHTYMHARSLWRRAKTIANRLNRNNV